MLRLLKYALLTLLGLVVAVALFFAFAVFSAVGREHTICRIYAGAQRDGGSAQLARVLPKSGEPGAPDAGEPGLAIEWLPISKDRFVPLPPGAWTLQSHGTSMVLAEGKDLVTLEQDEQAATTDLFNALGEAVFGRAAALGEQINQSYALDLTKPCDPAKDARALLLEAFLISLKSLPAPGDFLAGVRDQVPLATTTLTARNGGEGGYLLDVTMPGADGKWMRLFYLIHDEETARGLLRSLKDLGRPEKTGGRASVAGWDEALPSALGL